MDLRRSAQCPRVVTCRYREDHAARHRQQYPQLKANDNFKQLQDQLEGTENRIKVSRDAFNESVKNYNMKVTNFDDVNQYVKRNYREGFALTV